MAIIQMLNDEVIDVKETSDAVAALLRREAPTIKVTALDDFGEHEMWINAAAISSFMGGEGRPPAEREQAHREAP
jgi:hypothetical protein